MGWAVGVRGGLLSALPLVLLAAAAAPGRSLAAEPSRAVMLPGDSHAAVVADVDGDGTNELVRIVGDREIGHVVEAWALDDEAWTVRGSAPIPELTRSAGDRRIVPGSDASALLVWRADGRARVLVWAKWGAPADDPDAFPCCVNVYELIWQDGATRLEQRALDGGIADSVQAVDVDGDGTDELVRTVFGFDGPPAAIEVLRWDGAAFRSILRTETEAIDRGTWAGDTDGEVGDDLLLGPSPEGDIVRIAWVDGDLVVEEAHLDLGERSEGYLAGIADGAFVLSLPDELRIVRWARGEQPVTTAQLSGTVYPYAGIIGAGAESLLVVQDQIFGSDGSIPPLTIYDLQLNARGEVAADPRAERLADVLNRLGFIKPRSRSVPLPVLRPAAGREPRHIRGLRARRRARQSRLGWGLRDATDRAACRPAADRPCRAGRRMDGVQCRILRKRKRRVPLHRHGPARPRRDLPRAAR